MDQALDTRTLTTVVAAVAAVLLVAQILLWRVHREVPGTGYWVVLSAGLCGGLTMMSMRGRLPDALTVVVGNVAVLAAVWAGMRGIARFRGLDPSRRQRWIELVVFGTAGLVQTYLTYVTPSYRARVVLISAVIGAGTARIVWMLARRPPAGTRAVSYATASMFAIVTVVLWMRAFRSTATGDGSAGLMESNFWQSALFLGLTLCAIGWTLGLMLLAAQRVELDLRAAKRELEALAATDGLTGIDNRRSFLQRAEDELARASRYQTPLSVIVFDIDHFKRVNDTRGHAAGDQVLVEMVRRCRAELREQDAFGRLGGEEFAVLLPQTGVAGAVDVAERLRLRLAAEPVATDSGPVEVSASFGVTELCRDDAELAVVLHRADKAVYDAKADGRNQVSVRAGDAVA